MKAAQEHNQNLFNALHDLFGVIATEDEITEILIATEKDSTTPQI